MDKTTAWTIIGSVFVAILSQMINYYLIQRNEHKKFNKQRFQKLYSPSIYQIVDLLTMTGYYHSNASIDNTERRVALLRAILENITKNLEYASPELVNAYRKLDRSLNNSTKGENWNTILKDVNDNFIWDNLVDFSTVFIKEYLYLKRSLKV